MLAFFSLSLLFSPFPYFSICAIIHEFLSFLDVFSTGSIQFFIASQYFASFGLIYLHVQVYYLDNLLCDASLSDVSSLPRIQLYTKEMVEAIAKADKQKAPDGSMTYGKLSVSFVKSF